MKFTSRPSLICATVLLTLFGPSAAWAQPGATPSSNFGVSKETVFWVTFIIMTAILAFAFLFIALGLLRSKDWYLGDAISEEAGNQPDPLPAGIKPVMVASSSRLIALLGLLNILGVFLGFGYYFLYSAFAGTVSLSDMKSVIYYLFSGAVMFAPYLANQLREALSSFSAAPQIQPVQPVSKVAEPVAVAAPVIGGGIAVG
jgi:hypothetical protein